MLLFGFSPGRLVRLTISDVTISENQALLKIGEAPLPLPGPLATMIRDQVEAASTAPTQVVLPRADDPHRWVFPDEKPGQHADAGRLTLNLQQHLECKSDQVTTPDYLAVLSWLTCTSK